MLAITWAGVRTDRFEDVVAMFHDVLDMRAERSTPDAAWFRLPAGDAVHVYGAGDPDHLALGSAPAVGLLVEDHDAARSALERAGIGFLGPAQHDRGATWSSLRAADGSIWEVIARGDATPAPGSIAAAVRERPVLVAVVATYVVGWTVYGLATGSDGTLAYLGTMAVLATVVAAVHARVGLSAGVLWFVAAWGFAHMAGGLVAVGDGVLYNASLGIPLLRYDRVVHAIGFGTAAVACWQALRWIDPAVPLTPGVAVLIALMGMGVGALNEVVEFFASRAFAANVGGYVNTGWDLVANLVGCAVAGTALYVRGRASPRAV